MSILQVPRPAQKRPFSIPTKHPHWRLPVLGILFLISFAINVLFRLGKFPPDSPVEQFMLIWGASFLPYLVASFLVLLTRPQEGRWRWIELGLIFGGAFVLRAMLLPIPPFVSPDSWRYLWDARITLHGYSPYVLAPQNPIFIPLRNPNYYKMGFHHVPSIYPPAAQFVYLLTYIVVPDSLVALKTVFMFLDLVTCGALAFLLARRGLDPARVLIYAWCPLPIVDFAIQGHLDVIAVMFSVLAIASNLTTWRGSRMLTGFLIGMAALAKMYPILLLVVVLRRRDWSLLATCVATILLGYLPYVILGHGQVFGFFAHFANEHSRNSGPLLHIMSWFTAHTGFYNITVEHGIEALLVGSVALLIWWLRLRERISMEAAALILMGTLFVASSHIFPWYTTILLPWIAVRLQPIWTRRGGLNPTGMAIAMAWYFCCVILLHYYFDRVSSWSLYYVIVYDVTLVGLSVAALVGLMRWRAGKSKIWFHGHQDKASG